MFSLNIFVIQCCLCNINKDNYRFNIFAPHHKSNKVKKYNSNIILLIVYTIHNSYV